MTALMGIEPTYPSEKYGYIIPESGENVSKVKEFKEKPDVETAKKYLAQSALVECWHLCIQTGLSAG